MTCRWLLIIYSPNSSDAVPFGIALLVPELDTLYFTFRDDTAFIHPDDVEILAAMTAAFRQIATEMGASGTFEWMNDTLSNTVRVEGPFEIVADDPERAAVNLFDDRCSDSKSVMAMWTAPPGQVDRRH